MRYILPVNNSHLKTLCEIDDWGMCNACCPPYHQSLGLQIINWYIHTGHSKHEVLGCFPRPCFLRCGLHVLIHLQSIPSSLELNGKYCTSTLGTWYTGHNGMWGIRSMWGSNTPGGTYGWPSLSQSILNLYPGKAESYMLRELVSLWPLYSWVTDIASPPLISPH